MGGELLIHWQCRDKEAEADKSDREEEGQLAADGHGRDVEGEFDMTIGDREDSRTNPRMGKHGGKR